MSKALTQRFLDQLFNEIPMEIDGATAELNDDGVVEIRNTVGTLVMMMPLVDYDVIKNYEPKED